MKARLVAGSLLAALAGTVGLAQTPPTATSGASGGSTDYGLFFSKSLSSGMAGSLTLGSPKPFTASNGCTLSVQSDGPIACFTKSSCASDSDIIPFCVLVFSGQAGLTTSDVAELTALPGATAAGGSVPLPSGRSHAALYEALRHKR